ncbi:hypothetical protein GCM10009557_24910 [Virgisporangium ochraceum]|uniref:IPT/TIG domain-containing protein n=1 Tax=Virgisporangium ochraceum TaxID=65505 RepID=A0A8J4E983_9ACTN|nr:hypothetical protein Voc01_010910 [Virgisporangium ochraceum]
MSILRAWRRSRLAVGAAIAAVVSAVALVPASPASAATALTGNIVVSSPTTGKVAANTPKQVILLTLTLPAGTTLSEENIKTVSLGATRCTDMEWYIVTGTTQIAAKTPDDADDANDGCAPTASTTTGETIVITFANDDTLTKTGSNLFFITPPDIAGVSAAPVVTDNSSKIPAADDKVKRLLASGGQTVRITASNDFAFSGGTGAGLAVTIGGKALTEVKAWNKAGTTALTAAAGDADKGNTLTGKTASGMTASATPSVIITQNGVSKTFSSTATGITIVSAPVITALSVTSVKAGVETNVTVTGTGFATTATAKVCGVTANVATPPTSAGTSMVITIPATGIIDDAGGLGADVFSGVCKVVVSNSGTDSPVNEKSWLAVISE